MIYYFKYHQLSIFLSLIILLFFSLILKLSFGSIIFDSFSIKYESFIFVDLSIVNFVYYSFFLFLFIINILKFKIFSINSVFFILYK